MVILEYEFDPRIWDELVKEAIKVYKKLQVYMVYCDITKLPIAWYKKHFRPLKIQTLRALDVRRSEETKI